ncbi:hypothetical protein GCM10028895_45720 [Pontibacter rugosus]
MRHGVDVLTISGRATVNPFAMEEIASALKGTAMPVLVNNPVYPDLGLWLGALERLNYAGITDLGVINRGFAADEQYPYRSHPRWDHVLQLQELHPELPILCDATHIAGRRSLLYPVSQKAVDLGADGLLFESHTCPAEALSSAQQQLMPQELDLLINAIETKVKLDGTNHLVEQLDDLSQQMDSMDKALVDLLLRRREVSQKISLHQMGDVQESLQIKRWQQELDAWLQRDDYTDMDSKFVKSLMEALQQHRKDTQGGVGASSSAVA